MADSDHSDEMVNCIAKTAAGIHEAENRLLQVYIQEGSYISNLTKAESNLAIAKKLVR